MILTSEERSKTHVAAGLWGTATLDDLFRGLAAGRPDAPALADGPDGPVPGVAARYGYREADLRVEGLAAFFAGLGLKPDNVLGVNLPNVAEAAIVILAAWRAGLVVVPLPLHWTDREIARAVEHAGIRAIVTASKVEDRPCGEHMRDIAADNFTIRFVIGLGEEQPDGLIDLALVMADLGGLGAAPDLQRRGNAADHVAALSFSRRDGRLVAVPLTHNHLIALGRAHADAAGVASGATLASSMMPAGLGGLCALATALVADARLVCHHGRSVEGLVAGTVQSGDGESGPLHLMIPATLARPFAEAFDAAGESVRPALSLVAHQPGRGETPALDGWTVTDLSSFGGLTLVPVRRVEGRRAAPWPAGDLVLASGAVAAALRLKPRMRAGDRRPSASTGEIVLEGAIVPDAPWPEPAAGGSGRVLAVNGEGRLRTGVFGELTADGKGLRAGGMVADSAIVAGETIDLAALDARFARFPGLADAAAYALDDALLGQRVGMAYVPSDGAEIDPEDVAAFLEADGLGLLERPSVVAKVAAIPRGTDGKVERSALFVKAEAPRAAKAVVAA